jgi:hypothetical protein
MLNIVVAGLQKDVIERCVKQVGGDKVSVTATTDIDAAKKVKNGQADYYIGACNTGGGAALAMAIGILGYNKCAVIAKTGGKPDEKTIENVVNEGKVAFGTAIENIEASVNLLIQTLFKKHNL